MDNEMTFFYKMALLGSATQQPLCNEYKNEWRACGDDKKKLLKFALRQQCIPFLFTYSYKDMGLSKEYLAREYKDLINGAYTVVDADNVKGYTYELFVDCNRLIMQNKDVSAFMYCNSTIVEVQKTKCSSLFVGCKSDINISLEGYNSIRIYLYDESKVTIDSGDNNSDVTVYKYSSDAKVEVGRYCLSSVRIFDKDLRLQL